MTLRAQIAQELLACCPPGWHTDYCKIADALESDCSEVEILNMAEVHLRPGTYAWLAERL